MKWLHRLNQWLQAKLAERHRKIDLEVLWPAVKRDAFKRCPKYKLDPLETAREAFIAHMASDPAWRAIADNWTAEQLGDFVRANLT
jgi:hypothetical protein